MATHEKESGQSFLDATPARARTVDDREELTHEEPPTSDPWRHRHTSMRCRTCMFFVVKAVYDFTIEKESPSTLGRCRRHAPTMSGYPAVFVTDWCGDHKLDENK